MRYLVIKEETCPKCEGNYKEEKDVPNFYGDGTHRDMVYCTYCYSGIVKSEVSLEKALRDILRRTPSALANDIAMSLRN